MLGFRKKNKLTPEQIKANEELAKSHIEKQDKEKVLKTITEKILGNMKKHQEINQNLFTTYSYDSETRKNNVGIGIKGQNKPAKGFKDFETAEEIQEED